MADNLICMQTKEINLASDFLNLQVIFYSNDTWRNYKELNVLSIQNSQKEYTRFINQDVQPLSFTKHENSSRAEVYFNYFKEKLGERAESSYCMCGFC